jgi:hypothetical protein
MVVLKICYVESESVVKTDCRAQNWIKILQQEKGEVGGKRHGLVHAMRHTMR